MERFFENIVSGVGVTDILDIMIVTFIIYKLLDFIRETRAEQLAKGLLLLVVATLLSKVLQLYTLHWILSGVMTVGLIAVVVIFQPELRRGLEYLGRSKFSNVLSEVDKEEAKYMVGQLVEAIDSMSVSRTGALIVIEREISLSDIVETGTVIDAVISAQMVGNIFYEGAPLHDGALIIRGNRLYAAGCVLPLTQNKNLNKELGTRHRAGVGISEATDSLTIVVSEQTGKVSVAYMGQLYRGLTPEEVKEKIGMIQNKTTEEDKKHKKRKGKKGNEEKTYK